MLVGQWDLGWLQRSAVQQRLPGFLQRAWAPSTLERRESALCQFASFCRASGVAARPTLDRVAEYLMLTSMCGTRRVAGGIPWCVPAHFPQWYSHPAVV